MNPDSQQPAAPASATPQPQPSAPAPTPPPSPTFTPGPASPTPMGGPAVMGGKKSKKNLLIGVVVATLLVAAGVAYGVYAYVTNLPDNLMMAAVSNIKNEKSFAATFKAVSGTGAASTTVNGDLAYNTDTTNAKNGEALLGLGTGSTRVGINVLSLDGTLYLKFANMENIGALLSSFSSDYAAYDTPQVAQLFKNVNDQWFSLTQDDVKSVAQTTGNDSVAGAVSPADVKQVLSIYNQHPFIKSDKTYADEVVDGSNSAHFSLKVDKNENVAFLQAVKDANLSTIKVSDTDIADAKNANETSTSTIEVWIARDTKKFKQIRLVSTEKGSEINLTVTFMAKLPAFDKFEKPASARPLSDFTTLLLGSSSTAGSF